MMNKQVLKIYNINNIHHNNYDEQTSTKNFLIPFTNKY